jgi:phosphoglucomutase
MESNAKSLTKKIVETTPYEDQNPGTSGLRKKVTHFKQPNYLENFVQSIFNAHEETDYKGKTLVIGGDGRYYNNKAIQICIKIAAANGISKVVVAENGIMSTPAVSLLVRHIGKTEQCFGAIILTASHNPGGEHEDFGIKFNNASGAPAPENITSKLFKSSKEIKSYNTIESCEEFSLTEDTKCDVDGKEFLVKIESSTGLYVENMKVLFDFEKIKSLFDRKDFKFTLDAMHGAAGPYAIAIFNKIFGVDIKDLHNCNILPDFGGLHPDPNLVHAKNLVDIMDIDNKHEFLDTVPDFGAACDGDADRNMILGKRFFVSPSDSIAVIAANYKLIPNLNRGGTVITGVARSMPTSCALDRVAKKLGTKCYETPTGWKFFGNLMDAGLISLCGEESFGTGSDHIREKDGLWAVFCWLSILAEKNAGNDGNLIGVSDIVIDHWKTYGREYYCRFDYEGLSSTEAKEVTNNLESNFDTFIKLKEGNRAYIFEYNDIVDHSVSKNQGWIFSFPDGSRFVFRVSGTSSSGATIRIYFEKHVDPDGNITGNVLDMIKEGTNLVDLALSLSKINEITKREGPTVIT